MKNKYIFGIIIVSVYAQAEEKKLSFAAKTTIATASTGAGIYLLQDTIKTAIDLHNCPQQHTKKGLMLNAAIAAGLLVVGSYLFQQLQDEYKNEKALSINN